MAVNTPQIYTADTFSDISADFGGNPPDDTVIFCADTLITYLFKNSAFNVLSQPAAPKSYATPSRSLNSAFQISATRDSEVSYTVDISASLNLSGGATGTASLQYADDSGFTTNVVTVQSAANGNTGTLTIGLGLTQVVSATLTGFIPAGKYVRIATANTSGTPTFTYKTGQEVLV